MCGSGVRIGMVVIAAVRRPILRGLLLALIACSVVAAGTAMPRAAACRFVTASRLPTPATASACALPYSLSQR